MFIAPEGQAGRHAGAALGVLRPNDTAVFLDYLLDDGQTQPCALGLGGHIGFEEAVDEGIVDTAAIVLHRELQLGPVLVVQAPGGDADPGRGLVLHRLQGILDQIVNDLAQTQGVPLDAGLADLKVDLDRRDGAVEVQHLGHQPVQAQGFRLHLGGARIVGEVVDHGLHGLDLLDDGVGRAVHHPGVLLRQLGQELVAQALRRELDGGQRILDLVGQAPCHLAPGGVALGRDQAGDVVEDHHMATLLAIGMDQGAATTHQHLAALGAEEDDLLTPFGVPLQMGRTASTQATRPGWVALRASRPPSLMSGSVRPRI